MDTEKFMFKTFIKVSLIKGTCDAVQHHEMLPKATLLNQNELNNQ